MKFSLKSGKNMSADAGERTTAQAPEAAEKGGLSILSDRKRLIRIVAVLAVAGAAGQLVNGQGDKRASERPRVAEAALGAQAPEKIEPVAAQDQPAKETVVAPVAKLPAEAVLAAATPEAPDAEAPLPAALQPAPEAPLAETACPMTLDLAVQPGASVAVTLLAPCQPATRVVLRHEGLVVTGMTTATGALFASLPALSTKARIEADLGRDGAVAAMIDVPEASAFRRFGVQWQADDAFQVNAYENGADWGQPGHLTALAPGQVSAVGGFVQVFGDAEAPLPLLAEVYTWPVAALPVEVQLEAAVTAKTCGRELIAETLFTAAGETQITDLTLAMPACDAIGDFLVLKNLVPDVTLATN